MPVTLVERYNSNWPDHFVLLRRHSLTELDGQIIDVEHVGSTAIPGMTAKPIIDLIVVIAEGTFENTRHSSRTWATSSGRPWNPDARRLKAHGRGLTSQAPGAPSLRLPVHESGAETGVGLLRFPAATPWAGGCFERTQMATGQKIQ